MIPCLAETIRVGLEPFPPFITKDGQGYSVAMFRGIEKISDLTFEIEIMTYARAKHQLKYKHIDIAGHTPKNLEAPEFYQYGLELDWQISTTSDLFVLDKRYLDINQIKKRRIGTTLGNADFLADQVGLSADHFIEVATLGQLVDMLLKGRIDALLFERASVMTLLQEKISTDVYYQTIGLIPASIAVNNDDKGHRLKAKLDRLIRQLDHEKIFSGYLKFNRLHATGKVPLAESNH